MSVIAMTLMTWVDWPGQMYTVHCLEPRTDPRGYNSVPTHSVPTLVYIFL